MYKQNSWKSVHHAAMRSLTKSFRTRAAILIALAYAVCVLAPSVALAITDNPASFRCLDELNAINAPSHHEGLSQSHADGTVHHHDHGGVPDRHSGTDSKTDDGSCCGLFGVSALAHDPGLTFGISELASPALPAVANGLAGCAPSPLHRPPIA